MKGFDIMKKVRMSNGEYATCIEDFEDVIGYDNLNAINELINYNDKSDDNCVSYWKMKAKRFEADDDNKYQQMMSVYSMIEEMKDYISDSKRMNKQKMLLMLDDMLNQLDNY